MASVIGVTYATFTSIDKSNDNLVSIGKIKINYIEPENAYSVVDAMPTSDSVGKTAPKYFEFRVESHATTNASDSDGVLVSYNIVLSKLAVDSFKSELSNNQIKVYLTKIVNGVETSILAPTLLSSLSLDSSNNIILYSVSDKYKNDDVKKEDTYRLRMWIDSSVNLNSLNRENTFQYKFNINVKSKTSFFNFSFNNLKVNSLLAVRRLTTAVKDRGIVTVGNGLYSSNVTDSGNYTYYYRGVIDNNYVKIPGLTSNTCKYNGKQVYKYVSSGHDVVTSKEECNSIRYLCSMGYGYEITGSESACISYGGTYVSANATYTVNDEFLWKVMRINENGTTRIVLENSLLVSTFNPSYDNESYMYYSNSNVSGGAMKTLNEWYSSHLTPYDSKIATSTYCESAPSTTLSGGTGAEALNGFKCVTDKNGKGSLQLKVGLFSLAEVLHAGGVIGTPTSYYLPDGIFAWIMTPGGFGDRATVYLFNTIGNVFIAYSYSTVPLRPVISLNSDVLVTGSGTNDDPWVVI